MIRRQTIRSFLFLSLSVAVLFSGCDFQPLGKGATRFSMDPSIKDEYFDWRICPVDSSSADDQIKLRFLDTNSYVCRKTLTPGEYRVMMRKRNQAFASTPVTIVKDKWDYRLQPPSGTVAQENAVKVFGVVDNKDIRRVSVLFVGPEISLQPVLISDDGKFTVEAPKKAGNYSVSVYYGADVPQVWHAKQPIALQSDTDLGHIVLAK